jgi:hypothetical protein
MAVLRPKFKDLPLPQPSKWFKVNPAQPSEPENDEVTEEVSKVFGKLDMKETTPCPQAENNNEKAKLDIKDGAKRDDPQEVLEEDPEKSYYACYDLLAIHCSMINDHQRMEFYHNAIVNNSNLFKNKIVLDVGCGMGVLSMFAAKAGAKKVFAIEAANEVATFARDIIAKVGVLPASHKISDSKPRIC